MKGVIKKFGIRELLILAFLVRLAVLPFFYHSDAENHAIWSLYANEFGLKGFYDWLNFGNYAHPNYPPLAILLFLVLRWAWYGIYDVLWFLNVRFPVFPSNLMTWFDTVGYQHMTKLPNIFADLGIGYLIYNWFIKKGKGKTGLAGATLYLFNPGIIYLTSIWGQLEPAVSFFALVSVILLLNKKYVSSALFYFVSILTKVNFVPLAPFWVMKAVRQKISFKKIVFTLVAILVLVYASASLFIDGAPLVWLINKFVSDFTKAPPDLQFINLNAFNFWAVVTGISRIPLSNTFLRLPFSFWAYLAAAPFILLILWGTLKGKDYMFSVAMLFFAVFMFFPKIHERHFFHFFVFFPFVAVDNKIFRRIYWILALIFSLNLYHWSASYLPQISIVADMLNIELVVRGLSLLNLGIFGYLIWKYQSSS